mmetsp:Transcript_27441/g.109940  ORF Transcript_27441/g.109940 Transcript_27441/m.109940 type:complete len:381 (+) Transcript_27441:853-1995(+)
MWRFLAHAPVPATAPFKVVFAGDTHFVASFEATKRALATATGNSNAVATRNIELVQAASGPDFERHLRDAHVALPFMERITEQHVAAAPLLRLVVQYGVGLEGVDVEACTRRGIAVSNMPAEASGNAAATAEHACFLCLALLRGGVRAMDAVYGRRVLGGPSVVAQLGGKQVLVVGHGAVGRRLARFLRAFDADVSAAHAHRAWRADELHTQTTEEGGMAETRCIDGGSALKEALGAFDVIALCCPLTPETRGLVDADFLASCKRGAVLVNVGRGPLVHRSAVLDALTRGHLAGFASDVGVGDDAAAPGQHGRPSEPWDPDDELSRHPKAYFTPHVGGYSDVAYGNMATSLVDAVLRVRGGERPLVWVNEHDAVKEEEAV